MLKSIRAAMPSGAYSSSTGGRRFLRGGRVTLQRRVERFANFEVRGLSKC